MVDIYLFHNGFMSLRSMTMRYTEENAYKQLKEAIEHFGQYPTVKMYTEWSQNCNKMSYMTILKLTKKKWKELEVELRGNRDRRAREDYIIYHLQEAAKVYGESISKREYINYFREDK